MTRWLNHCKAQKSEVGCNQDSGSDSGFWVSLTSVLLQPQPGVNEHCITSNGRKLASFYSGRVLASLLRRQKRSLMMALISPISPRDVGSSLWTETLLYACSGNINVPITPDTQNSIRTLDRVLKLSYRCPTRPQGRCSVTHLLCLKWN